MFNSKRLGESYWMPEGIEQIFTFLKEGLSIPPEEITFHEDVWAGGGNYGPSIELHQIRSFFLRFLMPFGLLSPN